MCGILGIYNFFSNTKITLELQNQLKKIQHRGQDSYGYYLNYKSFEKNIHKLGIIESQTILNSYKIGMGHNRYATSYNKEKCKNEMIQPFTSSNFRLGKFTLVHNGNINNLEAVRKLFHLNKENDKLLNDSQILVRIIEESKEYNLENTLINIMTQVEGIFNLIIYHNSSDSIYALKDKFGNRPLCIGENRRGFCVVSETVGLGNYEYLREINPGEIVKIDNTGYKTIYQKKHRNQVCLFEYIYLQNKESLSQEITYEENKPTVRVIDIRRDFGEELARKEKYIFNDRNRNNIVVIGAPNTGIPIGESYAECLDLPYNQFISKRKGSQRSFIQPNQESRLLECYRKFIIDEKFSLENKIVFFVDDSLVRGNTIQIIVDLLKSYKPRELHIRIASPEVKNPCYYGIDIPTHEELVMHNYSAIELSKKLGINSLVFLKTEDMEFVLKKNLKLEKGNTCMGCFDGKYDKLLEF